MRVSHSCSQPFLAILFLLQKLVLEQLKLAFESLNLLLCGFFPLGIFRVFVHFEQRRLGSERSNLFGVLGKCLLSSLLCSIRLFQSGSCDAFGNAFGLLNLLHSSIPFSIYSHFQ